MRKVYSWYGKLSIYHQNILISERVPKELISRFVKLCPTCQIRRGMNRNSPPGDAENLPDFNDTDSPPGDDESPTKSRRESTISNQGSSFLHMPTQLVNSSTTFQTQNRWLSDFHPQAAYEGMYSPMTTINNSPSLLATNGKNNFDRHPAQSNSHHSSMTNVPTLHSRTMSSHEPQFKQDFHYCYD